MIARRGEDTEEEAKVFKPPAATRRDHMWLNHTVPSLLVSCNVFTLGSMCKGKGRLNRVVCDFKGNTNGKGYMANTLL